MTSVKDNVTKVSEYIMSCRQMGMKIMPPDINEGEGGFSVSDGAIRYGLSAIKSIGQSVVDEIVRERTEHGKFRSLEDFIDRMSGREVNKRTLESFIKSGAMDGLPGTRKQKCMVCGSMVDQKNKEKKNTMEGQTIEEIYDDIADLSGVRVSLYFPGDRGKVDAIISELFNILEFKQFPEQSKPPTYHKRFSGYWANHYRARMRDEILNESQKKYGSARIEIQVASLIMHAWSEVEHDLIYKPMQGTLSEEELSILDELNGLVLAGEIALERLQAAGNERLRSRNAAFGSQYELASYLYNFLSSHLKTEDIELRMGNIALLYRLLQRLQLTGLKDITPILRSVKFEKDRRTISQQIIDQIISGNEKRYQCYQELRTEPETASPETLQAVNQFLEEWVPLERLLNKTARRTSTRSRGAFNINTLKRMDLFDKEMINQIVQLRKLRNVLIHDIELPDQAQILRCTEEAKALLAQLTGQHDAMADGENGEKNSHAENT